MLGTRRRGREDPENDSPDGAAANGPRVQRPTPKQPYSLAQPGKQYEPQSSASSPDFGALFKSGLTARNSGSGNGFDPSVLNSLQMSKTLNAF